MEGNTSGVNHLHPAGGGLSAPEGHSEASSLPCSPTPAEWQKDARFRQIPFLLSSYQYGSPVPFRVLPSLRAAGGLWSWGAVRPSAYPAPGPQGGPRGLLWPGPLLLLGRLPFKRWRSKGEEPAMGISIRDCLANAPSGSAPTSGSLFLSSIASFSPSPPAPAPRFWANPSQPLI